MSGEIIPEDVGMQAGYNVTGVYAGSPAADGTLATPADDQPATVTSKYLTLNKSANLGTVGIGTKVTYSLRYANRGSSTARDVKVTARAFGALRFENGQASATYTLGDLTAGISSTLQIIGVVNTALNGRSAELDITLSDAQHGDFEWLWSLHPVDTVAPQNLTILQPRPSHRRHLSLPR